jgi:hypothetical protein
MVRSIKALLPTVMVALVLSAAGATATWAAEFHSEATETTVTVRTDGTNNTKQAHHAIDLAGATVTCGGISGHGFTKASTFTALAIDVTYLAPCTFVGQTATVEMKSCNYTMNSHGNFSITSKAGNSCDADPMKVVVPNPFCEVTIGSTGNQNLGKGSFKATGSGSTTEITVEVQVTGITYLAQGAGCPETGHKANGNYTTGNYLATGQKPGISGTHVGIWWE